MEFALISSRRSAPCARQLWVILATLPLVLASASLSAQTIQLSPAQQQMLNQLPPAERQQAMDAMDAMQQVQTQESTGAQQTINEPIQQSGSTAVDTSNSIATLVGATAQPRSRLIISFTPLDSLNAAEELQLSKDPVLRKLKGGQLFVLDDSGVLSLQGLELIPLLGLSEADINRRLMAEPFLSLFWIDARILSQKPIGVEALELFGYDVFRPNDVTLDSPSSGPVPPDYVLGPGDSIRVQLFGNVNGIYEYEVSRDGVLNLPEIGPVTVAGMPFSEFRTDLNKRVKEMLIGTQVSVTMGQLRTIRVFVLGDVNRPGSYVVSGLATISGALYSSGGISLIGSLRNIQLKRNGRVVSTLDAYDLLIRGDTSGNSRLQPGDVIFVPPIGKTVSVGGAVNRPAIYEVKRLTTAADLVGLAGGLTPEAFAEGARLQRIDESGERTVLSVNLKNESANSIQVRKGDELLIPEVLPEIENAVELAGHVHRPGDYPWHPGMRLTDLIESTEELRPGVDTNYILVRREGNKGEPIKALSASLLDALRAPGSAENIVLQAGDTVNVFGLALGRQRTVGPLVEELKLQATIDAPAQQVEVSGSVHAPGIYPLESDMRVSDLIRASGSLTVSAYVSHASLARYSISIGGDRETTIIKVDLDAIRHGDEHADLILEEYDYLIINRIPQWDSVSTVILQGEVMFPGSYRVRSDESLANIIQRAGGFTSVGFPEGAVFLRENLREQEEEQIEALARRMEVDLANLSSFQTGDGADGITLRAGQVLLEQLLNTEAVGRLVISLTKDLNGIANDVYLQDGDQLLVPRKSQVVTVLGETRENSSYLYQSGLSRDEYIDLSGGLTRRADKKSIYVVRANGAVIAGGRSKWFGRRQHNLDIWPGDTIVVPLDTERMRPLTFWGNVTQVLYQSAISVAAIKTLNN